MEEILKEYREIENEILRISTIEEEKSKALQLEIQKCKELGFDPDNLDTEIAKLTLEKEKLEEEIIEKLEKLKDGISKYRSDST